MRIAAALACLALLTLAAPAEARMTKQMSVSSCVAISLLGDDPVALHGKVSAVRSKVATVKVGGVIHGSLQGDVVRVASVARPNCFGEWDPFVEVGDEVLLFLWPEDEGPHALVDGWHGAQKLPAEKEKREEIFTAVRKLYAIYGEKDEDAKIRSLLALTESPNRVLREAARNFVMSGLGGSGLRERYAAEVLRMLESDGTFLVAACAAASFEAEEVFEVVLRACGDEDEDRRRSAVYALRRSAPARAAQVIPVLLDLVRRGGACEQSALATIEELDGREDPRGSALIEAEVPLLVRLCRRKWTGALYAVDLLSRRKSAAARETLEWAAKSHPHDYVRDRAKVLLEK